MNRTNEVSEGVKIKKGDVVVFVIGYNQKEYKVIKDEYEMSGRKVVDLNGYSGEVAVEYLKIVH